MRESDVKAGGTERAGSKSNLPVRSRARLKPRLFFRKRNDKAEEAGRSLSPRGSIAALFAEERSFGRVFLVMPVVLAAGVAWWFSSATTPGWQGLLLYWALAVASAFALRYRTGPLKAVAMIAALFLSGALLAQIQTVRLSTVMLDSSVTTHITGIVESREQTVSGWRYVVTVTATDDPVIHRPPHRVTLVARGKSPPVEIGNVIGGLGRLSPPSGPAMPGLVDFAFLSYFRGIGAVGFFYGPPTDLGQGAPHGLASAGWLAVETLRDGIASRIRAVLPGDTGAFANAILTGQRRALGDDTLDALRNAGLAHVIAISGLHMALAAGLFFSTLRLMLAMSARTGEAVPTKKIAAAAALAAALFYLLISGMQVSAERAFIMLAVMLMAAIFDRPAISLRNVALAAFVILIVTPAEAVGPGMQMSFAATLALIAGYGAWQKRPAAGTHMTRGPLRWLWIVVSGIVLTALIGGLSTMPFAIDHFSRVAGYGLLGNLLAMPVVTFIVMPAGLLSLIAMPLNLHAPFLLVMGWGLDWVIAAANWVNGLGGAFTTGLAPRGFLLLFLAGFFPLVLLRTRLRFLGIVPVALSFVLLVWPRQTPPPVLLVDADGDLLAIVSDDVAALNTGRPPSFVFEQWRDALSLTKMAAPEMMEGLDFGDADRFDRLDAANLDMAADALEITMARSRLTPGLFHCEDDAWCYAIYEGVRIMQVERPGLTGLACDNADIVVSRYRPGFQSCRSGAFLVTPALRRQTGSLQFTLMEAETGIPGPKISAVAGPQSDETHNRATACPRITLAVAASVTALQRPWNRHRLYDWRTGEELTEIPLPRMLTFSGSGESGQPACPEP